MAKSLTYKAGGVSIAANDELVRRIRRSIKSTQDGRVLTAANDFAGFFKLTHARRRYKDPVLVACSDGVGSKVVLAQQARRLEAVGVDLVAMNVNDMITCGAEPLFFLDYVAVGRNIPARTARLVRGMARGCRQAGCALLGGETAEMPDIYGSNDFDLAGFAVGIVDRSRLLTGESIEPGDAIIGLGSSGIHSNGYTLVRRVFFDAHSYKLSSRIKTLRLPLGAELLKPTRIYVKPVSTLLRRRRSAVKGLAHITGGGLPGNLPRILPKGCQAVVSKGSWRIQPIFRIMQSLGVPEREMYRVFNMGIGMVVITRSRAAAAVIDHFKSHRIPAYSIGTITPGRRVLRFK